MTRWYDKKAPGEVFKRVGFSGDHSKTLALVQSGSYEVGALSFKVYDNEKAAGNVDESKVSVIWRTPTYPDYNWSIRGDVEVKYGKGFIKKVQDALGTLEDKEILDQFPRARFIEADNTLYAPLIETGTAIGIFEK